MGPRQSGPMYGATWQWEHRTGFRDYSQEESDRIERHFRDGRWMMRLKTGKGHKAKPREVFFYDMIQFDPDSDSVRRIRRLPAPSWCEWLRRRVRASWRGYSKGDAKWWKAQCRDDFEQARRLKRQTPLETEQQRMRELYNQKSWHFRLVTSPEFNLFSSVLIVANCVWLGIDADHNSGKTVLDTKPIYTVADNAFCVLFSLELFLRFGAFRTCRACFRDWWFSFDFVLVLLMVAETWAFQLAVVLDREKNGHALKQFTALRTLRLLRISRLTRLFKTFPQLMVLIIGLAEAIQSLVFVLIMQLMLLFWFGVIFKSFAEQDGQLDDLGMGTVKESMWTLLLKGTFLDNVTDVVLPLVELNMVYALVFLLFIFVSNLTMLNMLVGILCQILTRVATQAADDVARKDLKSSVLEILECYDLDNDGSLRRSEFTRILENPDMQVILRFHDIDMNDLRKLENILFEELGTPDEEAKYGTKITFENFLDKVFQLRGGNGATVTDIVELRSYLGRRLAEVQASHRAVCGDTEAYPQASPNHKHRKEADACMVEASPSGRPLRAASPVSKPSLEEVILRKLGEIQDEVADLRGRLDAVLPLAKALDGDDV